MVKYAGKIAKISAYIAGLIAMVIIGTVVAWALTGTASFGDSVLGSVFAFFMSDLTLFNVAKNNHDVCQFHGWSVRYATVMILAGLAIFLLISACGTIFLYQFSDCSKTRIVETIARVCGMASTIIYGCIVSFIWIWRDAKKQRCNDK